MAANSKAHSTLRLPLHPSNTRMASSSMKAPSKSPLSDGSLGSSRSALPDSPAPLLPHLPAEIISSVFANDKIQVPTNFVAKRNSRIFQKSLGLYLNQVRRIWNHLPNSLRFFLPGLFLGSHLHALVCRSAERKQYFATFFLRNRPELELMRRLAEKKAHGSKLGIAVLACSKGAEVYSIAWTIRSARPDLDLNMQAVDISQEILDFAERGVYSLARNNDSSPSSDLSGADRSAVIWNTDRDQNAWIFERMTHEEMKAMFALEGEQSRVKPWLREGITWHCGDASDPLVVNTVGPQDMVVANRFLCHMDPAAAEKCLRNIARLVKPGGYLFVSGIDLDVRTKVAREMGWKPVMDLMKELHEGDVSLRRGWPLEYWGLEPFSDTRRDWQIRYASAFQIGE